MDTKSKKSGISEAEISMVLDTYMYMNFQGAREGMNLEQVLDYLGTYPDYQEDGTFFGEYTVVKEAAQNPEIGSLMIDCQSKNMGFDSGTAACTFYTPDKSKVYIAYRGTGDREWPDNGVGMTSAETPQQRKALEYFDETIEYLNIQPEQRLLVTGHSKGGNKAQFVTMETKHQNIIDACYSVDGQGFSDVAIGRWQNKYDQSEYNYRTGKLHGINGENDYVSVLGIPIIPRNQVKYVKTPIQKENIAGYHDIKYMFASKEYNSQTKATTIAFHGRKNSDTLFKGELGEYAEKLSSEVMKLPPNQRDGCAITLMQVLEMTGGSWQGVNQEKVTWSDITDFLLAGLPTITGSLLNTREGRKLLTAIKNKESFDNMLGGGIVIKVSYDNLMLLGERLISEGDVIHLQIGELLRQKERLPKYTNYYTVTEHRLKLAVNNLSETEQKLKCIGKQLQEIAGMYQKWDKEMSKTTAGRIVFSREIG